MKVLIITGGNSSEREISLLSAKTVKKNLEIKGREVELFDFQDGAEKLKSKASEFDVIFPVMHGFEGEDGSLYDFLETLQKPFVGQDCKGVKIAFNKILSKQFFDQQGLPTARWKQVRTKQDISEFGFPLVLKAAHGGSSREVAILKSGADLEKPEVEKLLELPDDFLVEDYLEGIEITVGVLIVQALPVIEIVPPEGEEFDYENKYNGKSKELVGAPSLDEKTKKVAQDLALEIHQKLALGPYSRTDLIVVNNNPIVLEVNSPSGVGLTPESLFPKAAAAIGISFPEFVDLVVKNALNH